MKAWTTSPRSEVRRTDPSLELISWISQWFHSDLTTVIIVIPLFVITRLLKERQQIRVSSASDYLNRAGQWLVVPLFLSCVFSPLHAPTCWWDHKISVIIRVRPRTVHHGWSNCLFNGCELVKNPENVESTMTEKCFTSWSSYAITSLFLSTINSMNSSHVVNMNVRLSHLPSWPHVLTCSSSNRSDWDVDSISGACHFLDMPVVFLLNVITSTTPHMSLVTGFGIFVAVVKRVPLSLIFILALEFGGYFCTAQKP